VNKYRIRPLEKQKKSYISSQKPNHHLDLSLGEFPCGNLASPIKFEFSYPFFQYPPNQLYQQYAEKIRSRFKLSSKTEVFFANGAYELVETVLFKLLTPSALYGISPQFNEIVSQYLMIGEAYHPSPIQRVIKTSLSQSLVSPNSIIYLDNPNNPTGYFFSLAEVRDLIASAEKVNTFVIIDEAYADLMPDSESAFHLINEFSNFIVVRSSSKGLGAAGLRIGYLIAPPDLSPIYQNIHIPFQVSTPSLEIGLAHYPDENSQNETRKIIARFKQELLDILPNQITILPTHPQSSMVTIHYPGYNLYRFFLEELGVLTTHLESFSFSPYFYSQETIRLRIPCRKEDLTYLTLKLSKGFQRIHKYLL
jgi:histidinol-phosphate aminotransferase